MYKQSTVGTKKVPTAAGKAKKKRITKIAKGGKVKNKILKASSTILKESTISCGDISVSTSESWSLTESIRQFVRQEVEESLMRTSIKRELAREASSKEKIRNDNEYVKLEDLKDIVNELITHRIAESAIESGSEQIQEASDKVLAIEQNLKQLTARMKAVEESVSEMRKGLSAGSQPMGRGIGMTNSAVRFQVPNEKPVFVSSSLPRLAGVSAIRPPPSLHQKAIPSLHQKAIPSKSSDDDSEDDSEEDLESSPSSTELNKDKTRVYDELITKFSRQTGGSTDPRIAFLEGDLKRRMAERQQFESNMLWYKKSPLTLQKDSHKKHFPNEQRNPAPRQQTQVQPQRPIHHPRVSSPEATSVTDVPQSDWLFEQ